MSAQEKEAALRELTTARANFAAAQDALKKAEFRFIELADGPVLARDSKKGPQVFTAGKSDESYKTDC